MRFPFEFEEILVILASLNANKLLNTLGNSPWHGKFEDN